MLRFAVSTLNLTAETSQALLFTNAPLLLQSRGRRRSLTPVPWLPQKYVANSHMFSEENETSQKVVEKENTVPQFLDATISNVDSTTRRVGLLARKIGMLPQWTTSGERILCTLLEIKENHVVSVTSPEDWYRFSIVGKRKAFNRDGPMYKVTVGALNGTSYHYTNAYKKQFSRAQVPVKQHVGSFLVTADALPQTGMPLDARHFTVGQFITVSGKSIDWGFQGGMHRWGMRGQPTRRTTKSHRRIGSVGSVGDARIWPGKRMPGHMGYEWVTISGLQIVRLNVDKQVIYVKGNVPGDIGEIVQLKDCLQIEKKIKSAPLPTWTPNLAVTPEETEEEIGISSNLVASENFVPQLFKFTSPSIIFTDADSRKAAGRDKTKAKIAKVKK